MKQVEKQGYNNRIGALGEKVAENYLKRAGYKVIETSYLKKWGEIDIVAREKAIIHFVEVKSVSYETKAHLNWAVSHETWRPEENVHRDKLKRSGRTIETWLLEKRYTGNWQFDVAVVRLVEAEKYATIRWIWNVIIE